MLTRDKKLRCMINMSLYLGYSTQNANRGLLVSSPIHLLVMWHWRYSDGRRTAAEWKAVVVYDTSQPLYHQLHCVSVHHRVHRVQSLPVRLLAWRLRLGVYPAPHRRRRGVDLGGRSRPRRRPVSPSTHRTTSAGRRTPSTPRLRSVCGTSLAPTTTPSSSSSSECCYRSSSLSSFTGASWLMFNLPSSGFSECTYRQGAIITSHITLQRLSHDFLVINVTRKLSPAHHTLATKSIKLATMSTATSRRIQVVADLSPKPATKSTVSATVHLSPVFTGKSRVATDLSLIFSPTPRGSHGNLRDLSISTFRGASDLVL